MSTKGKNDALDEIISEVSLSDLEKVRVKMRISANIDNLIKMHNWSKQLFAEKIDKHSSEITKWLSGTHNFTMDTLVEIAFIFGIQLSDLVEERDPKVLFFARYEVPAMMMREAAYNPLIVGHHGVANAGQVTPRPNIGMSAMATMGAMATLANFISCDLIKRDTHPSHKIIHCKQKLY